MSRLFHHSPREGREPLIRMVKRPQIPWAKANLIRAAALLGALLAGALIILLLGHNPLAVYADMLEGSFGSKVSRTETVKIAVPLLGAYALLSRLNEVLEHRSRRSNMMGAIAASYFALFHHQNMPSWPF